VGQGGRDVARFTRSAGGSCINFGCEGGRRPKVKVVTSIKKEEKTNDGAKQ